MGGTSSTVDQVGGLEERVLQTQTLVRVGVLTVCSHGHQCVRAVIADADTERHGVGDKDGLGLWRPCAEQQPAVHVAVFCGSGSDVVDFGRELCDVRARELNLVMLDVGWVGVGRQQDVGRHDACGDAKLFNLASGPQIGGVAPQVVAYLQVERCLILWAVVGVALIDVEDVARLVVVDCITRRHGLINQLVAQANQVPRVSQVELRITAVGADGGVGSQAHHEDHAHVEVDVFGPVEREEEHRQNAFQWTIDRHHQYHVSTGALTCCLARNCLVRRRMSASRSCCNLWMWQGSTG